MSAPTREHEQRREILQDVARLAGFCRDLRTIPGTRLAPDVFSMRPEGRSLFLGEAKHTESPDNWATFERLLGYLSALKPVLDNRVCRGLVMAVCFDPSFSSARWRSVLYTCVSTAGLSGGSFLEARVDEASVVVSCRVTRDNASLLPRHRSGGMAQ